VATENVPPPFFILCLAEGQTEDGLVVCGSRP
jgi:hypothetical protein